MGAKFEWRSATYDLDAHEPTVLTHHPCRPRKPGNGEFVHTGIVSERAGRTRDHTRSVEFSQIRWRVSYVGSSTIKATHGSRTPQLAFSARGPARHRGPQLRHFGIGGARALGALRDICNISQNKYMLCSQQLELLGTQLPSKQLKKPPSRSTDGLESWCHTSS